MLFPPFTFEPVYGTLYPGVRALFAVQTYHNRSVIAEEAKITIGVVLKMNDKYSVKIHRKAETPENKGFLNR